MSSYILRYKFVEGKRVDYKISVAGGLDIITNEGTIRNPINTTMMISQTITECNKSTAVLKIVTESVTAAPNMPKDKLPVAGSFSLIHMDDLGNVSAPEGKGAMDGFENSMMIFPEEAIEPGDSWVRKTESANNGDQGVFYTKYRFNGFDRKHKHLLNFSAEVFKGDPSEKGYQKVGDGSFSFNSDDGTVEDSVVRIKYEYAIPMPGNPGMSVRTSTNLRVDLEKF